MADDNNTNPAPPAGWFPEGHVTVVTTNETGMNGPGEGWIPESSDQARGLRNPATEALTGAAIGAGSKLTNPIAEKAISKVADVAKLPVSSIARPQAPSNAVINWVKSMHITPDISPAYDAKHFGEAHQKMMASYEAQKKAETLKKLEDLFKSEEELRKAATPVKDAIRGISDIVTPAGGESLMGKAASFDAHTLGRALAGGSALYQGTDAWNRFQRGDIPGAVIGGLGALGSGVSLIPTPMTRVGGGLLGIAGELGTTALDKYRASQAPEQPSMAQGGVIRLADGGQPPKPSAGIAGVYNQVGPVQGTSLSSIWNEHLASLPKKTEDNLRHQQDVMNRAIPIDFATGKSNPNYDQKAAEEFSNMIPGIAAMTAWHGTPAGAFEKFSNEFIGTGEGHQAFGHGMYFAENPSVAKEYQKRLAGGTYNKQDLIDYWQPGSIRKSYGGYDKVLGYDPDKNNVTVQAIVKNDKGEWVNDWQYPRPRIHSTLPDAKEFEAVVGRPQPLAGSLYKVDIPDEHIPKMIDWDKKISDHPTEVQDLLRIIAQEEGLPVNYRHAALHGDRTGEDFYNAMSWKYDSPEIASNELNFWGVPGIKYLDNSSRSLGAGTKNFVVFDPSTAKILERNNEPVGPLSTLDKEQ